MRRILTAVVLAVLLVGCATKGRLSLLDLDLRDPEQIAASKFEMAVPYTQGSLLDTNVAMVATATTQAIPGVIWSEVMDVLKVIKARIRIVSVEWDERGGK